MYVGVSGVEGGGGRGLSLCLSFPSVSDGSRAGPRPLPPSRPCRQHCLRPSSPGSGERRWQSPPTPTVQSTLRRVALPASRVRLLRLGQERAGSQGHAVVSRARAAVSTRETCGSARTASSILPQDVRTALRPPRGLLCDAPALLLLCPPHSFSELKERHTHPQRQRGEGSAPGAAPQCGR